MRFVTVRQLERDFGLPFTVAERILREQMALARQPYRRWNAPVIVVLAASLACTFASDGSWVDHVGHLLLLTGVIASSVLFCLTRRHAQAPILAAARAAAARPAD